MCTEDGKSDDERDDAAGGGGGAGGDAAGGENNDEVKLDDDGNVIPNEKKPLLKKRRDGRNAGAATLEANVDNLNQKKIDDDFEVDPLFRATAAQVFRLRVFGVFDLNNFYYFSLIKEDVVVW